MRCVHQIHRTRITLLPNFYGWREATTANTSELKGYVTLAIIFSAILAKISNHPDKQVAVLFRTYSNFDVIYRRFSSKSHHWPSVGRLRQLFPKKKPLLWLVNRSENRTKMATPQFKWDSWDDPLIHIVFRQPGADLGSSSYYFLK